MPACQYQLLQVVQFLHLDAALIMDVYVFNSSQEMDDLCVTCVFLLKAVNASCSVNIEQNSELLHSFQAVQTNGTSTASECITHLPSGFYNITVYENSCNENRLSKAVFAYNNFSILGLGTPCTCPRCISPIFTTNWLCPNSRYISPRFYKHH